MYFNIAQCASPFWIIIFIVKDDRYVVRVPLWSECRCDLYRLLETFFVQQQLRLYVKESKGELSSITDRAIKQALEMSAAVYKQEAWTVFAVQF